MAHLTRLNDRTSVRQILVGDTHVRVVQCWDIWEDDEGNEIEQYAGERVYIDGSPALVYINNEEVYA